MILVRKYDLLSKKITYQSFSIKRFNAFRVNFESFVAIFYTFHCFILFRTNKGAKIESERLQQ